LDGFDSIQICREGIGVESTDAELDRLFQAGIDPDSSNLPSDKPADWPSPESVQAYVRRCRNHVDNYLERAPEEVVLMALEHRQMHLETLAYMFHNVEQELKTAPQDETRAAEGSRANGNNEWCSIPAGDAVLGRKLDRTFGWDNEFEQFVMHVPAFRMQRFPVTNGEYLEFVKEGANKPHFWKERDGRIFYRGMFEDVVLPLDWPVYVTQFEAEAYAKWAGKSVATEEQFHRAAYGSNTRERCDYPWGNVAPAFKFGNFDFKRWEPESAYCAAAGESAFGVRQLVGNGWEWTSTPFGPFPGFKPRASYPGYSANFFDADHYVMKGGSARTAARLLRGSFRNWFRRDYPYMYAKFRCVEN
jgi:formylglycine-generating enzyme required for sulfatase activity